MVVGSSPVAVTQTSDFVPASSKEFLDIQTTIECGFTVKLVCDMTRTYSLSYTLIDGVSCFVFLGFFGVFFGLSLQNIDNIYRLISEVVCS